MELYLRDFYLYLAPSHGDVEATSDVMAQPEYMEKSPVSCYNCFHVLATLIRRGSQVEVCRLHPTAAAGFKGWIAVSQKNQPNRQP